MCVCVLDVVRANQNVQQLSSTLQQLNHREGRKEEQGLRGNVTSIGEDKPSRNLKAQSKAGNSVKVPTCQRVNMELEMLSFTVFCCSNISLVFSCQYSQPTQEPSNEARQRNYLCSISFNGTLSFSGAVENAAFK